MGGVNPTVDRSDEPPPISQPAPTPVYQNTGAGYEPGSANYAAPGSAGNPVSAEHPSGYLASLPTEAQWWADQLAARANPSGSTISPTGLVNPPTAAYTSSSDPGRYQYLAVRDAAGNITGYTTNPSFGIGGEVGASIRNDMLTAYSREQQALQTAQQIAILPQVAAPSMTPEQWDVKYTEAQSQADAARALYQQQMTAPDRGFWDTRTYQEQLRTSVGAASIAMQQAQQGKATASAEWSAYNQYEALRTGNLAAQGTALQDAMKYAAERQAAEGTYSKVVALAGVSESLYMAQEAARTGMTLDPYVAMKAAQQGFVGTLNVGSLEASRSTVPVRDYTTYVAPPTGAIVKQEAAYYPYGAGKVEVFGKTFVDPVSGKVSTVEQMPGRNITNLIGGGGDYSAQSGAISVGQPNSAVVYTRDFALYPEGDVRGISPASASNWRDVLAAPSKYSTGGELYGGRYGVLLDSRTIEGVRQASGFINEPSTVRGSFPLGSGILATYVTPEGRDYVKTSRPDVVPVSVANFASAPALNIWDDKAWDRSIGEYGKFVSPTSSQVYRFGYAATPSDALLAGRIPDDTAWDRATGTFVPIIPKSADIPKSPQEVVPVVTIPEKWTGSYGYEYRNDPLAIILEGAVAAGDTLTFGMWKPGKELLERYGQNKPDIAGEEFKTNIAAINSKLPEYTSLGKTITMQQDELTLLTKGKINSQNQFTGTPEEYEHYTKLHSEFTANVDKYNLYKTEYDTAISKGYSTGAIIPVGSKGEYILNPNNAKREYGAFSEFSENLKLMLRGGVTEAEIVQYEASDEFKNSGWFTQLGEGSWKQLTNPFGLSGSALQGVEIYATMGVASAGFAAMAGETALSVGAATPLAEMTLTQTIGNIGSGVMESRLFTYGTMGVFASSSIGEASSATPGAGILSWGTATPEKFTSNIGATIIDWSAMGAGAVSPEITVRGGGAISSMVWRDRYTPWQSAAMDIRAYITSFEVAPELRQVYRNIPKIYREIRFETPRPGITETTPPLPFTEPDISIASTIGSERAPAIREALGETPHVILGSVVMESQKTGLPTGELIRSSGNVHDLDVRIPNEDTFIQNLANVGETPAGMDIRAFESSYVEVPGVSSRGTTDEGIRRIGMLTRIFGEPIPNEPGMKLPTADEILVAGRDYSGVLNQEMYNVQFARKSQAFMQDLVPAEGKVGNIDARALNEQFRLQKDWYDFQSIGRDLISGKQAEELQAGGTIPIGTETPAIRLMNSMESVPIQFDFVARETNPVIGAIEGQRFQKTMTLGEIRIATENAIVSARRSNMELPEYISGEQPRTSPYTSGLTRSLSDVKSQPQIIAISSVMETPTLKSSMTTLPYTNLMGMDYSTISSTITDSTPTNELQSSGIITPSDITTTSEIQIPSAMIPSDDAITESQNYVSIPSQITPYIPVIEPLSYLVTPFVTPSHRTMASPALSQRSQSPLLQSPQQYQYIQPQEPIQLPVIPKIPPVGGLPPFGTLPPGVGMASVTKRGKRKFTEIFNVGLDLATFGKDAYNWGGGKPGGWAKPRRSSTKKPGLKKTRKK